MIQRIGKTIIALDVQNPIKQINGYCTMYVHVFMYTLCLVSVCVCLCVVLDSDTSGIFVISFPHPQHPQPPSPIGLRHAVGHLFDQVLVDTPLGAFSAAVGLAAVALPCHPSHGRRQRQAIVQGPGLVTGPLGPKMAGE